MAGNKIVSGVSDFVKGFTESDDTETTPPVTTGANLPKGANGQSLKKQEAEVSKNKPTPEQQSQAFNDAIVDAQQMAKAGGKRRPTQKQRDARARRVAIRRSSGETISAEQADRYINTGFMEKDKIANVTVGQYDYEQRLTPEGFITYKNLGPSGAAIRAAKSANATAAEAEVKKRRTLFGDMAVSALGRAAIPVVDDNGKAVTNIGPFHTQADFGVAAMRFIDNNAASIAPLIGFDPTIGNLDLGQQRLIEGVMTAYAASLNRSKSGEQIFSNTNDFSKFIKSYSAKSGMYIIGNRLVSLDDQVGIEMEALGGQGDPVAIGAAIRSQLEADQGAL